MIRAADPFVFAVEVGCDGDWLVVAKSPAGRVVISICQTEAEAVAVEATLVCAAAGRM